MCSFCKNQISSFRYFITSKQACNIWKVSKMLNLLFSKTTQGNSLKFFTMVLTNQKLLILTLFSTGKEGGVGEILPPWEKFEITQKIARPLAGLKFSLNQIYFWRTSEDFSFIPCLVDVLWVLCQVWLTWIFSNGKISVFACTCKSLILHYFIFSVRITSKIVPCHYHSYSLFRITSKIVPCHCQSIAWSLKCHVTSNDVKMPSHDVIFSKCYSKAFVIDFCYFGEYFRWFVWFAHQGNLYLYCFLIPICSVTILQFTNSCESLFNRYNL